MVFSISYVAQVTEGDCLYSETALKLLMESNEVEGRSLLLFYCSYVVSSFIIQSVSAWSSVHLVSLEILMLTLPGLYFYGLFNGNITRPAYEMLNGRMFNEWQIGRNVEGNGCGIIQGASHTFTWRNWGKLKRTTLRIVIWTEYKSEVSLCECYCLCSRYAIRNALLCWFLFQVWHPASVIIQRTSQQTSRMYVVVSVAPALCCTYFCLTGFLCFRYLSA